MHESVPDVAFPLPLTAYTSSPGDGLLSILWSRIEADPFNAVATVIFLLAVIHTFFAARFIEAAHRVQHRRDRAAAKRRASHRARAWQPRSCISWRGRGGFRALGRATRVRHRDIARLDDGGALSERHGQLHRTDVRRGDHGAGLHAADHRAGGRLRCVVLRISAAGRRAHGGSSSSRSGRSWARSSRNRER